LNDRPDEEGIKTESRRRRYTTESAPAVFEVQNCGLFSCSTIDTIDRATSGAKVADYHQPTGGGNGAVPAPLLAPAAGTFLAPGEVLEVSARLDVIDKTINEFVQTLFEFKSAVQADATGLFTYTYTATNHSGAPVDFDWLVAGLSGQHLDAAGGADTLTRTFVSALAPAEHAGTGDLTFLGSLSRVTEYGGPVPTYAPTAIPLPPALALLASGLLALGGLRRAARPLST